MPVNSGIFSQITSFPLTLFFSSFVLSFPIFFQWNKLKTLVPGYGGTYNKLGEIETELLGHCGTFGSSNSKDVEIQKETDFQVVDKTEMD